jgi:hypothetical protein
MNLACKSSKPSREYNASWVTNTVGCDFEATGYSIYDTTYFS